MTRAARQGQAGGAEAELRALREAAEVAVGNFEAAALRLEAEADAEWRTTIAAEKRRAHLYGQASGLRLAALDLGDRLGLSARGIDLARADGARPCDAATGSRLPEASPRGPLNDVEQEALDGRREGRICSR